MPADTFAYTINVCNDVLVGRLWLYEDVYSLYIGYEALFVFLFLGVQAARLPEVALPGAALPEVAASLPEVAFLGSTPRDKTFFELCRKIVAFYVMIGFNKFAYFNHVFVMFAMSLDSAHRQP